MPAIPVMRLFGFRPVGPSFDAILRDEVLPDLRGQPGVGHVWTGRQGPGETGRRVVVSLWASHEVMLEAMGEGLDDPRFRADHLVATTDRSLETVPIELIIESREEMPTTILRIARGVLPDGGLAPYVGQVRAGAAEYQTRGNGPRSLVLGTAGHGAFVTVSTWPDWASIARATGASLEVPIGPKRSHELIRFEADHYELIPT